MRRKRFFWFQFSRIPKPEIRKPAIEKSKGGHHLSPGPPSQSFLALATLKLPLCALSQRLTSHRSDPPLPQMINLGLRGIDPCHLDLSFCWSISMSKKDERSTFSCYSRTVAQAGLA